ncbi:hypothetical protein L248_0958 [Schleiferilactobacillus shenzhenensis LY-73]|uniref:Uncharacterized protein n=2 Tax=Schleiferilactobacillus shenzhenensis TaxID=1231337 RepID=U4TI02_9LACO|nr:hypothetical protein L248_0958 [Schleiferilactobacillus shenzhenensis LY-73]
MMLSFWRIKGLRLRFLIIFGILTALALTLPADFTPPRFNSELGMFASFFSINGNGSLFTTLLLFTSAALLITDYWITALHTHLAQAIIVRRSRRWLVWQMAGTTFVFTFLFLLVLQAAVIGVIVLVHGPHLFSGIVGSDLLLSDNPDWALTASIFTHCVGYAVFTDFVLMIGLWVEKPFIFRITGLVAALVMILFHRHAGKSRNHSSGHGRPKPGASR